MGKQSSRIYFQGKDHKDVYFQGKFHRAIYLGSKLLWEKLPSEKFFLFRFNRTVDGINYSNPRSFDTESHLLTDYRDYTQDNSDYSVISNNLFTRAGNGLYTNDGKKFFIKEFDEFESFDFRIKDGFVATMQIDAGHVQYYYVQTDKNVNEISRTSLYETERFFTTRVPVPCYPYYNEHLIVSRSYDQSSYYREIAVVGKHGDYKLEYTCNGYVLFCYCDNNIIFVFTTGSLHVLDNGSIKYRISVPSNIYACLKMKYEKRYILYARPSGNQPFALYQTRDFVDIEQINQDYLEIKNKNIPNAPYLLILNAANRDKILENYDMCYYHIMDTRNDIRNQLTRSSMFEDGKSLNFDSLYLQNISFIGKGVGSTTQNVYIDNLLFEESEKNYI